MKDISTYPAHSKVHYYKALFKGREPTITQNIKTRQLKIKQGRKWFKSDFFSLESYLKGRQKAIVFRQNPIKSPTDRLLGIIDVKRK
jgi:hypothetical protein